MADAQAAALRDVAVRYPGRPPLGPLDLTVAAGEIVALVGASGAGKSTTLRLLAGLEAPSSGVVARAAGPGRTGFVFQSATLMPWADARANVALPLELAGVPKAEAVARAAEALAAVGLDDRVTARPRELSAAWPCACPWPARWSRDPTCCCWTSRSRLWTASPAAV